MAQPENNLNIKIPPFLNSTGKPEMTVKRYWSRLKSYLLLTHKIRIDPLVTKQKDAVEKNKRFIKMKTRRKKNWHSKLSNR